MSGSPAEDAAGLAVVRRLAPGDLQAPLSGAVRRARRASDLRGYVVEARALERMVREGDPVVYETFEAAVPELPGHLAHGVTVIHPGRIGAECFMTKGHFHTRRETAEVYHALRGRGFLVMQSESGEARAVPMEAGSVAYVPPGWAHRTVNADPAEPFVTWYVFPADAGHDYEAVAGPGFRLLVVDAGGEAVVVEREAWLARGG